VSTIDPVLEESRQLLCQRAARLGWTWYVGAAVLIVIGGAAALWILLRYPPGDGRTEWVMGALAVMGLGLPLIPLGMVQTWLGRRLADRGELCTCRITGGCLDSMATATFGGAVIQLLRNVVPVRVVPFVPEDEVKPVAARLFADEMPIADEAGYRCLKSRLRGKPVWLLVCNRGGESPPPPTDAIEETGRFAAS